VCSPRESEWDADISHGSRDSPLNAAVMKVDWSGGPSYGLGLGLGGLVGGGAGRAGGPGRPATVRHYSLVSPTGVGQGSSSVVTFDIGQPGVRRHSFQTPRRPSPARTNVNDLFQVDATLQGGARCPYVTSDAAGFRGR